MNMRKQLASTISATILAAYWLYEDPTNNMIFSAMLFFGVWIGYFIIRKS